MRKVVLNPIKEVPFILYFSFFLSFFMQDLLTYFLELSWNSRCRPGWPCTCRDPSASAYRAGTPNSRSLLMNLFLEILVSESDFGFLKAERVHSPFSFSNFPTMGPSSPSPISPNTDQGCLPPAENPVSGKAICLHLELVLLILGTAHLENVESY